MQSSEGRGFKPIPFQGEGFQRMAAVLRGDVEPTPGEQMGMNVVRGFTEGPATIRAFHGSPHRFDRFDMSRIGTGEGAQAYGHGLYFAGNEGVARAYRDQLSQPSNLEMLDYFNKHGRFPPETGSMYEVNLNTTPDRLLDWDAPLSRQGAIGEATRNVIANLLKIDASGIYNSSMPIGKFENALKGRDLSGGGAVRYLDNQAASELQGAGAVSSALRNAGIDGIQYLDAGSRAAGDGSRNYVMFDDKLIDILRRYGIAGTLGGGAAATAGTSE
jgi:hypothetical protein